MWLGASVSLQMRGHNPGLSDLTLIILFCTSYLTIPLHQPSGSPAQFAPCAALLQMLLHAFFSNPF